MSSDIESAGAIALAIVGMAVALDLSLTGREVPADEALRLGLLNRVVPADQVMATAETFARMILGNSQTAIRSAKETLHDIVGRSLDDALRLETFNAYSADFDDVRERLSRFFNKPKP